MKKNVTYIDAIMFERIILASGLEAKEQAGFIQVQGPKGRRVYVAKTKTVARVDLSGFEVDMPAVTTLAKPFGAVSQQIDFTRPEPEILETFANILDHMKTLPEREIVRKPRLKNDSLATGWKTLVSSSSPSSSETEASV